MNKNIKQKWFLQTELLPVEVPNLFSNKPIIMKIDELLTIDLATLRKGITEDYTIPLNFKIPKNNNSNRIISIIHPRSQLDIVIFMMKYENLLLNFLKKSNFNCRKPVKFNKITYNEKKVFLKKMEKLEQNYGMNGINTISNEEIDCIFKKYFSYNTHFRLEKILNSPQFKRDSHKYRYFLKLDIQNFFSSIYTHSLTWAVIGDKNIGKTYYKKEYKSTFASCIDTIQQKCNYNETNGIVIGPEFNRIISDVILSQCDVETEHSLIKKNIFKGKDYTIYRYMDDFFIFSHKKDLIELIEKEISHVLDTYNLCLSSEKREILEYPFSFFDTVIIDIKKLIRKIDIEQRIVLDSRKNKDLQKIKMLDNSIKKLNYNFDYQITSKHILINKNFWDNIYNEFQEIIAKTKNKKRKAVLYFLKSIKIEFYEPAFIKVDSYSQYSLTAYMSVLYSFLENITNIFLNHVDSETCSAFIKILLKIKNSVNNLSKLVENDSNSFFDNTISKLELIENKIFEKIILVIRINISNLSNISDLISFSKSLNRKLSSQLLCEILEKNKNNYFVLCAIAYYIKDNDDINKLYKIVLRKLYQQILDFIQNFPTTITPNKISNKLRDSNYFYILNDFSFYTGFTEQQKEKICALKQSALEDMQKYNNAEYSIYKKLMEKSYFNWELNSMDFEKLLIKKILTNNSRNINY